MSVEETFERIKPEDRALWLSIRIASEVSQDLDTLTAERLVLDGLGAYYNEVFWDEENAIARNQADEGNLVSAICATNVYQSYPLIGTEQGDTIGELFARSFIHGHIDLEQMTRYIAQPSWEKAFVPDIRADDAGSLENIRDYYWATLNGAVTHLLTDDKVDEAELLVAGVQEHRSQGMDLQPLPRMKKVLPHLFADMPGDEARQSKMLVHLDSEKGISGIEEDEVGPELDIVKEWVDFLDSACSKAYALISVNKFPGQVKKAAQYMKEKGFTLSTWDLRDHALAAGKTGSVQGMVDAMDLSGIDKYWPSQRYQCIAWPIKDLPAQISLEDYDLLAGYLDKFPEWLNDDITAGRVVPADIEHETAYISSMLEKARLELEIRRPHI